MTVKKTKNRSSHLITEEAFKDMICLPMDAVLTGVVWDAKTCRIEVYYATESAPLIGENWHIMVSRFWRKWTS